MVNISNDCITYILCPANYVTGGTELLHQLCDSLNNIGLDCKIVYSIEGSRTPIPFSKYNVKIASSITDHFKSVAIIPEIFLSKIQDYKHCKIICWWLSVDNFFYSGNSTIFDSFKWNKNYALRLFIKRLTSKNNIRRPISLKKIRQRRIYHLFQSEYAHQFLIKNKFDYRLPLSDYLNDEYLHPNTLNINKENIILYNPKKSLPIINTLIKKVNYYKWIPLENLSIKELINLYAKSKLYVDFGNHPGKDRIPREAVVNNCCLLTSKNGSANFYEDIPIPEYYKINLNKTPIKMIISKIEDIINNYDEKIIDFKFYLYDIKHEKSEFKVQVNKVFL